MISYDFIALVSRRARKSTKRHRQHGLITQTRADARQLFQYHAISALQPPVEEVLFCIAKAAAMLKVLFDYRLLLRAQENLTYTDLSTLRARSN